MSFYVDCILDGSVDTSSSSILKSHFDSYCSWCWGHGFGNCDICRREYRKLYIPMRIAEKQKELGLPQTKALGINNEF